MKSSRDRRDGYTFIEVMIVVSIVSSIALGGIASFSSFRERSIVQADALMVADRLGKIQSSAVAVDVPAGGCSTEVTGYRVTFSGNGATTDVLCGSTVRRNDLELRLSNAKFRTGYTILFNSNQGGATPVAIDVCSGTIAYRVNVNGLGIISNPVAVTGLTCP